VPRVVSSQRISRAAWARATRPYRRLPLPGRFALRRSGARNVSVALAQSRSLARSTGLRWLTRDLGAHNDGRRTRNNPLGTGDLCGTSDVQPRPATPHNLPTTSQISRREIGDPAQSSPPPEGRTERAPVTSILSRRMNTYRRLGRGWRCVARCRYVRPPRLPAI